MREAIILSLSTEPPAPANAWKHRHIIGPDGDAVPFHVGQNWAWDAITRFIGMISGTQGGKALPLDTPIPTPDGFKPMKWIRPGDRVFDETGQVVGVVAVTDAQYNRPMYELEFDDGSVIRADANHQWRVQSAKQRKNAARRAGPNPRTPWIKPKTDDYSVLTTAELIPELYVDVGDGKQRANWSIDLPEPVQYPWRDLLIPPYTFGCWLGDGTASGSGLTCADPEIIDMIREDGIPVGEGHVHENQGKAMTYYLGAGRRGAYRDERTGQFIAEEGSFVSALKTIGVFKNKHIPEIYLLASVKQRLALLQGIMDTDGHIAADGRCEITIKDGPMSDQVVELCRSLGIKTRIAREDMTIEGRVVGVRARITFTTDLPVARLPRKADRLPRSVRPDVKRLFIVRISKRPTEPVKCISVDGENELYLASRDYIVTHNTSFGPWWLAREIYGDWIFGREAGSDGYFEGRGPGDYLAVTSSFDLFKLKMLPTIRQVFETILGIGKYWPSSKILELKDPATGQFWATNADDPMWGRIILRSANAEGGLESASVKGAWLDEAGQDDFQITAWRAIRRRIALYSARVLITTTLYNIGWVKQEIIDKAVNGGQVELQAFGDAVAERTVNLTSGVTLVQFDSIMNPAYPKADYEAARESMPEDEFAMQYRGRVMGFRGLIYDCFDIQFNRCPRFTIPPHWPRYLGLDFGGIHMAGVFFAEDPKSGILYGYREYLAGSKTIGEHAGDLLGSEPGIPYTVGGAKSEDQWRVEFGFSGSLPVHQPMVADVAVGISRVYKQLKLRRLVFFEDLEGTLDQFGRYRYKRDKAGEPTKEIENKATFHYLDCIRYIISSIRDDASWVAGMAR